MNIAKSNFVVFHPPQEKKTFNIRLSVNDKPLKEEPYIQYLGVMLDSHLNWKARVSHVMKKTKRNIGLISKLRYFVNTNTLSKWFEPRSISSSCSVIVRVSVILKRTVGDSD